MPHRHLEDLSAPELEELRERAVHAQIIERLGTQLMEHGFEDVKPLPRARVPVIKFRDPETGISCDICINNSLAVENSKLLRDYARCDPRVRDLIFVVKYWARRRKINDPYRGTLSSYALSVLVISFCQTRDPPVVPSLQNWCLQAQASE
eukprot:GABV01004342.1.p1 GENE.GABV01004342.1~~GABV01004342.1.p1  ORF type:complete len:150 (+),score=34.62 GABV01004342.1:1-450(+)